LPALLAILLTAGIAVLHRFDSWLPPRIGSGWNSARVPVRAADFVREAGLAGKRFNGYADGGYLEWALPEQPGFADARVQAYPDSFWRDFQQAEKSGRNFRAWMDALGVEWAVATRVRERLGGLGLFNSPDWALVHWDSISEVWVARKAARLKPVIDKYEYRHFRPYGSIVAQLDKVPRDEIEAFAAEIDRYQRISPEDPFAQLVRCGLATRAGSAAAQAICDAAQQTGHPSVLALLPKARAVSRAP
jgi:hypothetical protein